MELIIPSLLLYHPTGMPIEYLDATTAYPSHYLLISGSPSSSHLSSHPKRQLIDSSNSEDIESIIEEELEEIAQEAELMEGEVDESEWEEEAEDILGGWFGSDEDADENQEEFTSTKFVDEEEDDSDGYYELLDTLQLLKSNGSSSTNHTQLLLLERVTILSTPVITALLISFFILIPILAFGIYALTGIQVSSLLRSVAAFPLAGALGTHPSLLRHAFILCPIIGTSPHDVHR